MKKLIAAALLCSISAPAMAGTGNWYKDDRWNVEANSDAQYCIATTSYNDGRIVSLSFKGKRIRLYVSKTSAEIDMDYKVYIGDDSRITGHLIGKGIGNGIIVFENLLPSAVWQIAKSKRFYVDGIGSLEMSGSFKAISKAIECEKAMRELL